MNVSPRLPTAGTTALVVVDMQNGFLDPEGSCAAAGFPVERLRAAIEPCRQLIAAARGAGIPLMFTRYTHKSDSADAGFMLREKFPVLADRSALLAGSWDHAIVPTLKPEAGDLLIDKYRPSSFFGTDFEATLVRAGVTEVVVCGVTTNCCVESTVRDAAQRDFRTFVVSDAVAEWDDERNSVSLKTMNMLFAHVVTVGQLRTAWAQAGPAACSRLAARGRQPLAGEATTGVPVARAGVDWLYSRRRYCCTQVA